MSRLVFKMPDLGEGTVAAEIVAWHTKPGDVVSEDQVIVEVMTDKAAVEVPAPVSGRIVSISGAPGDKVAVGAPLIVFDVADGEAPAAAADSGALEPAARMEVGAGPGTAAPDGGRVKASPANRRRARAARVDLATVAGSGPGGRIVAADIAGAAGVDLAAAGSGRGAAGALGDTARAAEPGVTEIKVIGLRRVIAERMSEAKRTIPHFSYIEEVDVSDLEALRLELNAGLAPSSQLTYLPFVIAALALALRSYPQCNALYDAARGVLMRHDAVHVGVATQTPDGLKVPVIRNAEAMSLAELAAAVRGAAERARGNRSTRGELTGSTITVTSLGKLGGIASTPVINLPEVAIIGLNKAVERPVVRNHAIVVRRIMNLSASFDHRFVDGYDAAAMIQALKELLEHPQTTFPLKVNAS